MLHIGTFHRPLYQYATQHFQMWVFITKCLKGCNSRPSGLFSFCQHRFTKTDGRRDYHEEMDYDPAAGSAGGSMPCSVMQERPPPHEHEFDLTAWEYNEDSHWHKAVCEHTDEVKDKAAHTWDDGTVTTPAAPGSAGVMTYKCTVCKHTKTGPIPAPGATRFASTYTPGKTYDKTPIEIDRTKVVRVVGGTEVPVPQEQILKIEFKTKDAEDSAYTATAPTIAGSYTVKVTVAKTPDWEEDAFTHDFVIGAIVLVGSYTHPTELTYNGEEQTLTDLTLKHGDLGCILEGDEVRITYIKTKGADAGTPYVSYAIPGGQNYRSEFNDSKFGIKATVKPIVVKTSINATKVYDGSATIIHKDWAAVPEILSEDKGNLELSIGMKDANVVSEGNAVFCSFQYRNSSGTASPTGNYEIDKSLLKGTIAPKDVSCEYEHPYDGKDIVVVEKKHIKGAVENDNVTLKVKMSGKDVGASVTDDFYLYVDGKPSGNYIVRKSNVQVKIVAKRLIGTFEDVFTYNGTDQFIVEDLSGFEGFAEGDDIKDFVLLVVFMGKDAGSELNYCNLRKKGEAMGYDNYKIDLEDIHSSIVPKKLTAKTIPTKVYDGTNIVELPYDQLEGLMGSDDPILSITMSGKDVGSEYKSHVVKFVSGALASNYYVADDDPNMLQANITKKVLKFPSLNVTARPDSERYVYVHLGKANLEGWDNKPVGDDVVKVKYENNSVSWALGKSFLAASGSGTISEISNGNYDVQIPATGSRITVIPASVDWGKLEIGKARTFTVSDKTVKFYGSFGMEKDRVMKITNKDGAVMTMKNLLTLGEASKNTILYQENLEGNQGILIKSYPNGTGDFYVHGLEPGEYTILLTDN